MPNDQMPLIEFLTSPINKRGIVQEISGNGKIKTVDLIYNRRMLESNVATNQPNPKCVATDTYGDSVTSYTIDPTINLQASAAIGINDGVLACQDDGERVQARINAIVDVLDRKVATYLTTQVAALTGTWGASVPDVGAGAIVEGSVKSNVLYTLAFDATTGALKPRFLPTIKNALDDSGFPSDVFFAGGNTLRSAMQLYAAGCCTDQGIDLGELMAQFGYAAAKDKRLATVLGNQDTYLAFAPGAVQILNFSRAEGKPLWGQILAGGEGSNYMFTTVASPRFGGLTYDLTASDNCGVLSLVGTATVKAVGLPADMYATGDEYFGTTGVVKGKLILS